jgi:hypothetical protein
LKTKNGLQWKKSGELTKKGNPRHPLFLEAKATLNAFDINKYLAR